VRVPPFGVTQCIAGPRHTSGTPPNVVETSAEVWLGLVTGGTDFATALEAGSIEASGTRADLSEHLPLFGPAESEERPRARRSPRRRPSSAGGMCPPSSPIRTSTRPPAAPSATSPGEEPTRSTVAGGRRRRRRG